MKKKHYTIFIFSAIVLISILMLTIIHGNPPSTEEVDYDVPDEIVVLCQKITFNDANFYSKLFLTAVDLSNNEMIILGYTFEPGQKGGSSRLEYFKRTGIKIDLSRQKNFQVEPLSPLGNNFFKNST